MHRVHKIKLEPTNLQATYFARASGVARFAYNWALAEWKKEYEAGGKPSEAALRKKLNAIKKEQFPWMADVTKVAPQNAIKNVGAAFQNFFRRVNPEHWRGDPSAQTAPGDSLPSGASFPQPQSQEKRQQQPGQSESQARPFAPAHRQRANG